MILYFIRKRNFICQERLERTCGYLRLCLFAWCAHSRQMIVPALCHHVKKATRLLILKLKRNINKLWYLKKSNANVISIRKPNICKDPLSYSPVKVYAEKSINSTDYCSCFLSLAMRIKAQRSTLCGKK